MLSTYYLKACQWIGLMGIMYRVSNIDASYPFQNFTEIVKKSLEHNIILNF